MTDIKYDESKGSDKCTVTTDGGEVVRAMNVNSVGGEVIYDKSKGSVQSTVITEDGQTVRAMNVVNVGGGGGSVDYANTVQRAETMPTADASNAGQQFLYSGESDATYTHGYIYENVATTTSSSASAEQTVGSTLSDIAVDLATLESFTGWTADNSLQIFYTADGWSVDTTSLGVTYTGTPNVGDAITITYTAESTSYAWTQIDVQPASVSSVNGHTGIVQLNALDVDGVLQIDLEADKDSLPLNTIFQYVGNEVGATLHQGWFYRVITVHEVGLEQSKVGSFTYTIDEETYMTYADPQPKDNYRFKYNTGTSSWSLSINSGAETPVNLADYGITVDGTLTNTSMLWVRYYTQRETVVSNITVQGGLKAVGSMNIAPQRWSDHQATSVVNTFTTGDVVFVEPQSDSADEWVRCGVRLTNDYTGGTLHFACDITPTTRLDYYYVVVASSDTHSGIVMNTTKSQYIQYSTMPTAGVDYVGKIVQYIGATDANYTNGYFYKCVSDGQDPATYSWEAVEVQAGGSGVTSATASLAVADWSSNTQTVNVTGVTASNNVIVAPDPASQADYSAAGILCTAQGAGTLTFTCTTVPSSAITVNVLII